MKKEKGAVLPEQILSFVVFTIGDELFGLNILQVKEITNLAEISPVPNPPPFIQGLIDLRGTLVPIIDLRKKLGFSPFTPTRRSRIIIVSVKGKIAGFIADEVKDVVRVEKEKVKNAPLLIKESGGDVFPGVFKMDSRMVFIMDLEKLFTEKEIMDMKKISEAIKKEVKE